jgi:Peptidase propeptide and YPEB domain
VIVVNAKKMIIVAAAALMLLVGAGVAYASGSSGDTSGQATGPNLDKAKSVALEQVNGQVTGSEVGDEEGAYQIEVTKADGTKVDVNIDKNFNVINAQADNEGQDSQDGPQDASDNGGG